MRIGIVTGEYPPMQGGVGAYTQVLARALIQQGHTVQVYTHTAAQDADIPLQAAASRWGIGAVQQLAKWARTAPLDVINLQYQTAAFQMSPWIHFIPDMIRHIPVATTFHDLNYPYLFPKADKLRHAIVKHLATVSDGAVATNHEDMARLKTWTKAALIPIGSNIIAPPPAHFEPADWRNRVGLTVDDFVIGYFGFMNHSKGIEILLEALAALRDDGIPVRLLLIGGRTGSSDPTNAAYADEIDALIAQLGVGESVHTTGFIDDAAVSAYLAACDAIALPYLDGASYRRGTLMAAIQHGCAIVTTQPSVAISTFTNSQNMLLVPPGDAHALAGALKRVHRSPELRERLRTNAKALSRQFDWQYIAADLVAFFETLQ